MIVKPHFPVLQSKSSRNYGWLIKTGILSIYRIMTDEQCHRRWNWKLIWLGKWELKTNVSSFSPGECQCSRVSTLSFESWRYLDEQWLVRRRERQDSSDAVSSIRVRSRKGVSRAETVFGRRGCSSPENLRHSRRVRESGRAPRMRDLWPSWFIQVYPWQERGRPRARFRVLQGETRFFPSYFQDVLKMMGATWQCYTFIR